MAPTSAISNTLARNSSLAAVLSRSAGPRQRERFEPIAAEWIDLPAGSFKEQRTNINAAIVVIDARRA